MGFSNFFYREAASRSKPLSGLPIKLLHEKECQVCPLNREKGLRHPHMDPAGSQHPVVYILGEAPGKTEDRRGTPFVGRAGELLRFRIPEEWLPKIRWNNCVRTQPPKGRDPAQIEVECCRPSVVRDIERTKPKAIFGFGNVPLKWAIGQPMVTMWSGRRVPVKIGKHVCWFYPMMHPSFILNDKFYRAPSKPSEYGSEKDFAFALDLKRAFAEIETLAPPVVDTREDAEANIELVDGKRGERDVERVISFLRQLDVQGMVVGLDYETKGLRPYSKRAKILSVALSCKLGTMAIGLEHREAGWTQDQLDQVFNTFFRFLKKARCTKAVHNLAFELEWSAFFFSDHVLRAQPWSDTMAMAYILDERQGKRHPGCHSLEFLVLQYFGLNIKGLSSLDRNAMDDMPLDVVLRYNGIDAKYHRALHLVQMERLRKERLVDQYRHQLRRVPALVLTQKKGMPVNHQMVSKFHGELCRKLDKVEVSIDALKIVGKFKRIKGWDFRPGATADVLFMFRTLLKVKLEKADENNIKEIDHPLVPLILDWRDANKLLSTYVKPLRQGDEGSAIHDDGLLHPIYSTVRTRTWRTSSEEPNAQNFPVRGHKEIRQQIKPAGTAHRVVAFDYAGIQARNVAMESKDKALVASFWDRYDIHKDWAEYIAHIYPRWVKEGMHEFVNNKAVFAAYRHIAKNKMVFPSFFGAQARSIAGYLEVPEEIGEQLHRAFWAKFPNIKGWQEGLKRNYRRHGYVSGLTGFRRRAPISPNEIINAPIQADEAFIVLEAMCRLSELEMVPFQANIEVHDDLTFIWPKDRIDEYSEVVIREMLIVPEWARNVPIGVERKVGHDWGSMSGAGEFFSDDKQWAQHVQYVETKQESFDPLKAGPEGKPNPLVRRGKRSRGRVSDGLDKRIEDQAG